MKTDFLKNTVKDAGKANKSLSLIVKMKPRHTRFSAATTWPAQCKNLGMSDSMVRYCINNSWVVSFLVPPCALCIPGRFLLFGDHETFVCHGDKLCSFFRTT